MNKFIYILITIFCLIIPNPNISYCQISSNNAYVTDLDLALQLSKDTDQKVLLIFSASWCAFCQQLKTDLPTFNNLEDKIICILDTDSNKKLSKKFKVKTLPSSFLLNKNGETIGSHSGYDFNSYNKWLVQ